MVLLLAVFMAFETPGSCIGIMAMAKKRKNRLRGSTSVYLPVFHTSTPPRAEGVQIYIIGPIALPGTTHNYTTNTTENPINR